MGPTYTMGDFNARTQNAKNITEQEIIGPHTFDTFADNSHLQTADVQENRNLFISHCIETNTKAANTWFEKPENKKITFRHMSTEHGPPWTRSNGYRRASGSDKCHRRSDVVQNLASSSARAGRADAGIHRHCPVADLVGCFPAHRHVGADGLWFDPSSRAVCLSRP